MEPTASPSAEPRSRADWARAAEGIQLAGIAVFLLLNTTGVLPWSFWLDAAALWPVLLMSAGIRIAFEKSRAPWLLLAGPALILGSLAWVASGARADAAGGPVDHRDEAPPRRGEPAAASRRTSPARDCSSALPADRARPARGRAHGRHARERARSTAGSTAIRRCSR